MSATTVTLALLLYPLLWILQFNWVRFLWGFRQGLTPMPPEVKERAEAVDRGVVLLTGGALLAIIALMLRDSSISTDAVGLSLNNWKSAVAFGALASFPSRWVSELHRRNLGPDKLREDRKSRGPLAEWLAITLLGAFSRELWRAFCIVGLIRLDIPTWGAVLITAAAFGVLQLSRSVATAIGTAAFGCFAGFLFVQTGSLLCPVTMSLIAAGSSLYEARHPQTRTSTSLRSFTCPSCSQTIERMSWPPGARFACPNCREQLKLSFPTWPPMAGGIIGAALTLIFLHLDSLLSLVLFVPLFFIFALLSGFGVAAISPKHARVEFDRSAHGRTLIRF